MAKQGDMNEVDVVRFFEDGPIDKVEVIFNIVREKMRERLRARGPGAGDPSPRSARKRSAKTTADDASSGEASPGEA